MEHRKRRIILVQIGIKANLGSADNRPIARPWTTVGVERESGGERKGEGREKWERKEKGRRKTEGKRRREKGDRGRD